MSTTVRLRRRHLAALAGASALAAPMVARGQSRWKPEKPITIYNPFAAGGVTDVHVRMLGETVTKVLGQQVIVENEARSLLKEERHRKNQEEDERLRVEYLEMQQVQEARREKAFKDMYAKSQGRAALAGAQVAKEAEEKKELK